MADYITAHQNAIRCHKGEMVARRWAITRNFRRDGVDYGAHLGTVWTPAESNAEDALREWAHTKDDA